MRIDWQGTGKNLLGDGIVLCPDLRVGYIGVWICQNTWFICLSSAYITVHEFYIHTNIPRKECLQSLKYVHYNEHSGGPKGQWDIIKEMIYLLKQGLRVSVLSLFSCQVVSNSLWPHKWSEVAQLYCPTLCNPMDYRPLGSSIHGIFQARIL